MATDYLDSSQGFGNFLVQSTAGLYGFSTLEMLAKFTRKGATRGSFYVPWSSPMTSGKGPLSFRSLGRSGAGAVTEEALNADIFRAGMGTINPAAVRGVSGVGRLGFAQVALSRGAGAALFAQAWSDPVFFALEYWNKPFMWPLGVAWFGGRKVIGGLDKSVRNARYVNMGGNFQDSMGAMTSRQRAVRAISESHLQARSAIGSEAQLLHR